MWRTLVILLAFPLAGCAGSCQAVGGGAIGGGAVGGGAIGNGAVGGAPPGGACSSNVSAGAILDLNFALDCTGSSAAIASITNDGSTADTFSQATEARKPTCQSTCTGLGGGAACAYFDGGDDLISDGTVSTWQDLHDNDALTFYVVAETSCDGALCALLASMRNINNQTGAAIYSEDRGGASPVNSYKFAIGSAGGSVVDTATAFDSTWAQDTGHVASITYDNGIVGDDLAGRIDESSVGTVESSKAGDDATDAADLLNIGARDFGGPELQMTGYIGRILAYDSLHDAATIAANESALDCQFGNSGWPK